MSDHFATYLLKEKERTKGKKNVFQGRSYANLNGDTIKEALESGQVENFSSDPVESWRLMKTNFIRIADQYCPVKIYKIRNDRPLYFMDEISRAINERDLLFTKART